MIQINFITIVRIKFYLLKYFALDGAVLNHGDFIFDVGGYRSFICSMQWWY